MLISIAMMFLVGMSMGWICKKIHLPSLFGMIVTGIVLGPYVLDVIDASILNISSDLRRIALIIILMRAGLSLDLNDLKKVGRPAVLMCFVPACFEIGGMVLLAPKLLGISILDAAIMGTVIAAVSPAVIVPKMLKLMEEGYGVKKSIPQMILAGASVDDVFVIVMFTAFTGLAQGDQVSAVDFINIPISIAVGALAGFLIGFLSAEYFKKIHIRDTSKVIILVCVSFLLVTFEDEFASVIPFASLIAVMTMGIALQQKRKNVAKRLSAKFNKLWVGAEVMLYNAPIGKAEQWQNKEKNNDGQTDVSWISKMPIVPNTCVDLQELFVIVLGIVGNFRPFVEYLMLIIDEGGKLTDTAYNNFFEKHKKVQEDIMERDNNKEDLDIKEIMKIIHSYIL